MSAASSASTTVSRGDHSQRGLVHGGAEADRDDSRPCTRSRATHQRRTRWRAGWFSGSRSSVDWYGHQRLSTGMKNDAVASPGRRRARRPVREASVAGAVEPEQEQHRADNHDDERELDDDRRARVATLVRRAALTGELVEVIGDPVHPERDADRPDRHRGSRPRETNLRPARRGPLLGDLRHGDGHRGRGRRARNPTDVAGPLPTVPVAQRRGTPRVGMPAGGCCGFGAQRGRARGHRGDGCDRCGGAAGGAPGVTGGIQVSEPGGASDPPGRRVVRAHATPSKYRSSGVSQGSGYQPGARASPLTVSLLVARAPPW